MRALVSFEAEVPDGACTEAELEEWLRHETGGTSGVDNELCERLARLGVYELANALVTRPFVRLHPQRYPGEPTPERRAPTEDHWPERILHAEMLLAAARPFVAFVANGNARATRVLREIDIFAHKLEEARSVTYRPSFRWTAGPVAVAIVDRPAGAPVVTDGELLLRLDGRLHAHYDGIVILLKPWKADPGPGLFLGWRKRAAAPAGGEQQPGGAA